jgi:ABC-2 type transport system ATP-binding protein
MIIQVDHLSKSFDYYKKELGLKNSFRNLFFRQKLVKEAVQGISFQVEQGEMLGFLGPNGAGKTTTLKLLSGILHPSSGSASVLGFTPWERKKAFKMQFAIVMGQKNQLWWDLPANESLYLNKSIYEVDDREYEHTLAELTELLDLKGLLDVQVRRLSLGERMKMELIAALLHSPRVVYLDEPTIGLDLTAQRAIRDFILQYRAEHHPAMILTSHYMEDIERLCRRIIILRQGEIVFDGSLEEVVSRFAEHKVITVHLRKDGAAGPDLEALSLLGQVEAATADVIRLRVPRQRVAETAADLLRAWPVTDLGIEEVDIGTIIEKIQRAHGQERPARQGQAPREGP